MRGRIGIILGFIALAVAPATAITAMASSTNGNASWTSISFVTTRSMRPR